MGRSHVWRCRFALGERRPRGGRTVLTWGQSSGENQLTGSAIVTERHREKSRRGQTSHVATHLHRSNNFNEARELHLDLEMEMLALEEDPFFVTSLSRRREKF